MRAMFIPEGFAHGFQCLERDSELLYLHTASYAPDFEAAVRFDDPAVGIAWPLPPADISRKDRTHALIDNNFQGITL
jgi:dTDP-4-dehydrorhamnose 3,5-epimerase